MIDLDAARAARREADKRGPVIKLDGKEYELSVEMPFGVLDAFRALNDPVSAAGAMGALGEALLGEHYEEIRRILTVDDLNELLEGALKEYGVAAPLASPASS